MTDQRSSTLVAQTELPKELQKRYLLKRIEESDIDISEETRNGIIACMQNGDRFVQVGEYTIMINSIKSIDPKHGDRNVPREPDTMIEEIEEYTNEAGDLRYRKISRPNPMHQKWVEAYAPERLVANHSLAIQE